MYCPNCGKTNVADQNFCRSCGLQLEKVMQSLTEQLSTEELNNTLSEKQRKLDKVIQAIALSTVSIFVVSVLCGLFYKIIIVKGEVLAGLVFLTVILGLVLSAILVLYRESLRNAANKREIVQPKLQGHETAKLLSESQIEPVPSVTDRTTELLEVAKGKRESS